MACSASFPASLELTCLQEGLADIKAGNKKAGLTKLLYAAGCGIQLLPEDKRNVGAAVVPLDALDEAAMADLEAALPEEGKVAALPAGLLLKLLVPVIQQIIVKFLEGMDDTK